MVLPLKHMSVSVYNEMIKDIMCTNSPQLFQMIDKAQTDKCCLAFLFIILIWLSKWLVERERERNIKVMEQQPIATSDTYNIFRLRVSTHLLLLIVFFSLLSLFSLFSQYNIDSLFRMCVCVACAKHWSIFI